MKHRDRGAEQRKRKSSDQKIRSVLMRKLGTVATKLKEQESSTNQD